jgi:hypothetical protein
MGTINYKTSDYITIGYNCNNIDYEDEFYHEIIQDYFDQVTITRARYNFYYFRVSVEPGYYEGFYIDIEHNVSYCYDNYMEKRAALKEITQIRKFLYECVSDFECCAVSPGWCTSYYDYDATLKKIDEAIKEMRETVKQTPTWATLPESEKIPLF